MKNSWYIYFTLGFLSFAACSKVEEKALDSIAIRPTLEARTPDGKLYTPSTQSLLRTHSWMETANTLDIKTDANDLATFVLDAPGDDYFLKVTHLPIRQIVPRLHYPMVNPPDDFDRLNLLLAEYSRNSLSVPQGNEEDAMAHYQSNLPEKETVPWKLVGDYDFKPNPLFRPQRVSVINNCLNPGLWEFNASDRSGEIYHAWFDMPLDYYYDLVARTNGLEAEFVKTALHFEKEKVLCDLDRLREKKKFLGSVDLSVRDEEVGFSSQGSRRKLHKRYASLRDGDTLRQPQKLSEFYSYPIVMSSFVPPGVYSYEEPSEFDFRFLANPMGAEVSSVLPKTSYKWNEEGESEVDEFSYVEINIDLGNKEHLILGNLPLQLLVQQEDFAIHGFGVGILNAGGLAERRKFLIEMGPAPSFAYLVSGEGDNIFALNSHLRGVEQVFIRTNPFDEIPNWEITVTSYERIVDLVKYRVEIPKSLQKQQKTHTRDYIPPVFFSYRDDNIN